MSGTISSERTMGTAKTEKTVATTVRTPDQRLRVFVSSTLQELAAERSVARRAITRLHLIPVYFESGARPHPPRRLYRAYLEQSHIFIGIYWQRYGWVAPGMDLSGLADEYQLASHMPRLIYIKTPAPDREQGLVKMLAHIQGENQVSYKYFRTPDELGELIANDLAVMLSERFEHSLLAEGAAASQALGPQSNLPLGLNRFIGREEQLAAVYSLLEQEHMRLISLTGAGGVGKTRLALRVGSGLLGGFEDGVWLIDLASLSNPDLVAQLVATVLGIREEQGRPLMQTLIDHLYPKSLLLILDNCEHLIEGVALFTETLLRAAPKVRMLATSREPLGVVGEMVYSVQPLSSPGLLEAAVAEVLMQYEAVKLFVDRATSIRADFKLTDQNAPAVAQICARLDGIPLAIELAAARVKVLTVEEVATRLDDRFHLLVGNRTAIARQQTLRALIDWSYDLLSESERILLRRLSLFAGGWTLQAAEEVCSGENIKVAEVLDLLSQLIDKSLVIAEVQDGIERYRLLGTIRQYGQERLIQNEEKDEFARKHAEFFLKMAKASYAELWGPKQCYWLARLERDHDNLRAALEWMTQDMDRRELLLRLAGSLWRFWEIRGYIGEGRVWLERALNSNPDAPVYLRANGLRGAGNLARLQGDYVQAKAMHEQSLSLFHELEHKLGIARELDVLGQIEQDWGNYKRATELHEESLSLRYEIGDKEGVAASLGQLAIISRDRGHYRQAAELLTDSLKLNRDLGDSLYVALSLNNLGLVAYLQCDYEQAISLFGEALSLYRELDDKMGISNILHNLGNVAKDQGDFKKAVALYDECHGLKQRLGDKRGAARAVASMAELLFLQGNYPLAKERAEQSLIRFKELGVKRGIIVTLEVQAFIATYQGDYEGAYALAADSLALSDEIDAPRAIAYAKNVLGLIAYAQGNLAVAMERLQESLAIFRKIDDKRNIAHILVGLARAAYRQGDHASATRFLDESLFLSRELNIRWSLAYSLEIMGLLKRSEGDYEQARELFQESLRISADQENQQGVANCLGAMAGLAVMTGKPACSVPLFAAAEKMRETLGARMGSDDKREYQQYLDMVHNQLSEQRFKAAWSTGYAMDIEEAIEAAFRSCSHSAVIRSRSARIIKEASKWAKRRFASPISVWYDRFSRDGDSILDQESIE